MQTACAGGGRRRAVLERVLAHRAGEPLRGDRTAGVPHAVRRESRAPSSSSSSSARPDPREERRRLASLPPSRSRDVLPAVVVRVVPAPRRVVDFSSPSPPSRPPVHPQRPRARARVHGRVRPRAQTSARRGRGVRGAPREQDRARGSARVAEIVAPVRDVLLPRAVLRGVLARERARGARVRDRAGFLRGEVVARVDRAHRRGRRGPGGRVGRGPRPRNPRGPRREDGSRPRPTRRCQAHVRRSSRRPRGRHPARRAHGASEGVRGVLSNPRRDGRVEPRHRAVPELCPGQGGEGQDADGRRGLGRRDGHRGGDLGLRGGKGGHHRVEGARVSRAVDGRRGGGGEESGAGRFGRRRREGAEERRAVLGLREGFRARLRGGTSRYCPRAL